VSYFFLLLLIHLTFLGGNGWNALLKPDDDIGSMVEKLLKYGHWGVLIVAGLSTNGKYAQHLISFAITFWIDLAKDIINQDIISLLLSKNEHFTFHDQRTIFKAFLSFIRCQSEI
jgi:hypothetical protein